MKGLMELLRENELVNRFITDYRGQLKNIAVISILIIAVLFIFVIKAGLDDSAVTKEKDNAKETKTSLETIFIDIGGAVNSPMLAELPDGSRVEDAIVAAGGLTENADLTSINRAEFLTDGEKIYIPAFEQNADGDESEMASTVTAAESSQSGKVNINTADLATLQTLNGVGPVTAQKIIDYRTSNGRFKTLEDIKNVSGIGEKTYGKLKDFITT